MTKNIVRDDLKKTNLQEINPTAVHVGATSAVFSLLISLFTLVLVSSQVKRKTTIDRKLSKKINEILQSGNKWIVHILNFKQPNAFSLGIGRHIYITNTLLELLNEREKIAVLLHEVYHSSKKHSLKYLVFRSGFLGMLTTIVTASISVFPTPLLGLLLVIMLTYTFDVLWRISISRLMETKADSYATKYGYGRDLITALTKLQGWISQHAKSKCTSTICKIIQKIDRALDAHPTVEKRVKNILEDIAKLKTLSISTIKRIILKHASKNQKR